MQPHCSPPSPKKKTSSSAQIWNASRSSWAPSGWTVGCSLSLFHSKLPRWIPAPSTTSSSTHTCLSRPLHTKRLTTPRSMHTSSWISPHVLSCKAVDHFFLIVFDGFNARCRAIAFRGFAAVFFLFWAYFSQNMRMPRGPGTPLDIASVNAL